MFTVTITSLFTGYLAHVGDTAELFIVPLYDAKEKKFKDHWLNGKWLISNIEHYSAEENIRTLMSKTTLIRPTYVGKEDKLTLSMANMLYKVPG
jgi:hypothetical protein